MEIKILNMIEILKNPFLDKLMIFITSLGNGGIFFILIGLYLLYTKKNREIGLNILLALVFCLIFGNLGLKPLVGRARPYELLNYPIIIKELKDFSFPSGHTFSSFATAMSIYFYNKKYGKIFFCLASLIAFSRLYLYVHYPSDILGGIVLGLLCAFLARKILIKYLPIFSKI